ncbi:MAG: efflux RND transporter periplasmic adaptor subunit [Burkholderiaceae bacterium]|nr:efflux RND transporter periplasmic adaptor subunit [Burkholderiaceae bacterium]
MKSNTMTKIGALTLLAAGLLGAASYGLYWLGMERGMGMTAASAVTGNAPAVTTATTTTAAAVASNESGEDATQRHITSGIKAGDIDPANGRKVLYYHDPMVPANKFDKPGKSPFMDMMMSPVYADADGDESKVTVSPRVQQNLGLRTAAVTQGRLSPQLSAVGNIAFNERDQVLVQARATGYVERLHVRATLDRVNKGQPLADIYTPDWIAAQEEFLSVRRMQGTDLATLVDAARQRMRQAGMSDEQIRLVESSGKTQSRFTLTAPVGGVVVELMAREGMTVMPGATLFRINGLSTVWVNAEVPESQVALIRPGTKVQATSAAAPGTILRGTVQAIVPEVNASTRTLKARVELPNPGSLLLPGMLMTMQFMDMRAEKSLLIPTEAVMQTGRRTVVMLAEDKGKFRPIEVETGTESNGQTEIKRGLQIGQRVVVSSQFLVDSEASLRGVVARLNDAPKPTPVNTAPRHVGEAKAAPAKVTGSKP